MKKYNLFKKLITVTLVAVYLLTATVVSAVENASLVSDSGYVGLDLSLTKTVYKKIGETGIVKAAVIKAKDVTMYSVPYYSNTSSATSEKYYAVKVDTSSTADSYTYLRSSSAEKVTLTARPQRVMLSADTLSYSSDNENVATVSESGVITVTGYGVSNITVIYNGGTPEDIADDVKGAVTVFAVTADSNLTVIDNTLQWTDSAHTSMEARINKVTDKTALDILEPSNIRFKPSLLRSAFDPIGDDSTPLTMQVVGNENASASNNIVSSDTVASGNAALIEAEYGLNSPVLMQGWYYESGKGASASTVYPKLSFAYTGIQGANSVWQDGRRAYQLGCKIGGNYRIWGGDYNTYSSRNYTSKDSHATGITALKATAEQNYSGIDTSIPALKGWHQFAVTAEPSMVNPGTDYVLTKVYLDGKLITAQDIYIGDIPVEKRRVNILLPKLQSSTGYTSDAVGTESANYMHYKGITVSRFNRTEKIVDSIPSDGAQNVPLYQTIRIRLGSPVDSLEKASLTLNGAPVNNAELDASGTIITINTERLLPDTDYTLSAAGDIISFKTTDNADMADILDDMKTLGYSVSKAHSLDFADNGKSAEEYGMGFMRHCGSLSAVVKNGVATFEEGVRSSQSDSGVNAIILRNIAEYDSDADRFVVSYKIKLNVPSTYAGDTEYAFPSKTKHAGGIGVPVLAKENASRYFTPITRSLLSGTATTTVSNVPYTESGRITLDTSLLKNNTGKNDGHAYALSGAQLWNSRASQTSLTSWRQIAYVIDVDKTGQKAPEWYFVDINNSTKNLMSENAIYKVTATAGAGYTWVDSLYIPISTAASSVTVPTSLSVKDVEMYSLSLDEESSKEMVIEVKNSADGSIVYADELSGKTVDIKLDGNIPAGSTVIFAAYDKVSKNIRMDNIKTVSVKEESTAVSVENFKLPESDDTELGVLVWNSIVSKDAKASKYIYTLK